ncbi:MAG: hypothetical protein IJ759_03970 [Bacteroidales bacterium]|nr:hypothetical protein [Bacteroidales bacterium]
MKKIFSVLALSALMLCSTNSFAQFFAPGNSGDDPAKEEPKPEDEQGAPVGTATVLMLGLGAAALGYKVRKNRKDNE